MTQKSTLSKSGSLQVVFMSIRTQFIRKILDGSKTFELRRRIFPAPVGRSVVFYSSGKDKAITARGVVARVVEGPPEEIWAELESQLGLSRSEFFDYFDGSAVAYAIELKQVSPLQNPVTLTEMREHHGLEPPQSWRYLRNDLHADLLERL